MSNREDRACLEDILESLRRIDEFTTDLAYQDFLKDLKTQDAVLRNLEITTSLLIGTVTYILGMGLIYSLQPHCITSSNNRWLSLFTPQIFHHPVICGGRRGQ